MSELSHTALDARRLLSGTGTRFQRVITLLRGRAKLTVALLLLSANAHAFSLEGTPWSDAAQAHGVDPYLLYSIALVESQRPADPHHARPWPWTLNVSGRGYYYATREAAVSALQEHLDAGIRNIDVGPLQVNLRWNGHLVPSSESLFDLSTAAHAGGKILAAALASSPDDIVLGIGRYYNWDTEMARAYGQRVLNIHQALTGYIKER